MSSSRRFRILAIGALVCAAASTACGQKAAPDVDPPAKENPEQPSSPSTTSTSTTTAPTTTTTVDPGTLPQTNDRPDAASPEFKARMDLLWQAILTNDPDKAIPSFFPLTAYQQVKDLKDPVGDWNNRLIGAFRREIAGYNKQLQSQLSQQKAGSTPKVEPQLVSINVPNGGVQWMGPKTEYNKIGYFRVLDSKLNYTINGKPFSLNIKSLISWRGQWYVVHLASF